MTDRLAESLNLYSKRICRTDSYRKQVFRMQVLVFSDSHGLLTNMKTVIRQHLQIDHIIHLGDYGTDVEEIGIEFPHLTIDAVQGNCDRIREHPAEKVLKLDGKSILLTHEHSSGKNSELYAHSNSTYQLRFYPRHIVFSYVWPITGWNNRCSV